MNWPNLSIDQRAYQDAKQALAPDRTFLDLTPAEQLQILAEAQRRKTTMKAGAR